MNQNLISVLPGEVFKVYNFLCIEVSHLYAKFKIFLQLYSTSQERNEVLNQTAPIFFSILQNLLIDDILISICRLTDKSVTYGRDNISFAQLEDVLNKHNLTMKSESKQLLIEIENAREPFKIRRDKIIAHNDLNSKLRDTPTNLPIINIKKIRAMLKLMADLLNDVRSDYVNDFVAFDAIFMDGDADALFYFLEKGLEN